MSITDPMLLHESVVTDSEIDTLPLQLKFGGFMIDMEAFAGTLRADVSDDGVLWLTKVNAESGYGISIKMLEALGAIFSNLKKDASVRAVVIDAEGDAFQNGAVVASEIKPSVKDLTREDFAEIVALGQSLGHVIADADVPVIGIARGGAVGGGFELMLRTDFAFCTDQARFCLPEVTVGFIAAWGGTQWGGRYMPFRKAQEVLLTGLPMDGKQAAEYGLLTRSFADSDALDKHVTDLLNHLRHCSPASLRWTKKCLAAIRDRGLADGEKVELQAEVETMATGDYLKGLRAYGRGSYFDFVSDTTGTKR